MDAILKIDEQGRVKLPATILDALHVGTPGELRAHASSGKLELTPVQNPSEVVFIQENGILVAANKVEFDADSAIEATRGERL